MLTINDLINIQYIPQLSEISLSLLVDFYEQYLCKRIYIFELVDGRRLKLFFKGTSEIFHISGIDHIYDNIPMDGTHFVEGIKNKTIDFTVLENINRAAFTDYTDRIRSMACIDTILKNSEYLWFTNGKIPGSTIKVKYLLLKGLDSKNLHLGIDTYKEGRPYFSKTLLVTEGNLKSKYVNMADARLRVASIEILDKDTNTVLERIERLAAMDRAAKEIEYLAEEWADKIFPEIYSDYKTLFPDAKPNSRKKKEWASKLEKYLESKQESIRDKIREYDPYWMSKIVSEQIKRYCKNKSLGLIDKSIGMK